MDMTCGSLPGAELAVEPDGCFSEDCAPRMSLSIFADRLALRSELGQDALEAGLRLATSTHLGALVGSGPLALGDIVLVDCPLIDAAVMAGLARLDVRAARAGATVIVSTSIDALDSVFACLDQSGPQILVGPGRAERLVALGQAIASRTGHVAELSEADRMMLVRLAEQVAEIAARLERIRTAADMRDMRGAVGGEGGNPRLGEAGLMFRHGHAGAGSDRLTVGAPAAPVLPDPRMVRAIIRQRQLRNRFFPADLFADPAWDILLDLTAAQGEGGKVSVSSLCIASGAAPTTALRWIALMTEAGLLQRENDTRDRRRAFITLTESGADAMARYFAALGREGLPVL